MIIKKGFGAKEYKGVYKGVKFSLRGRSGVWYATAVINGERVEVMEPLMRLAKNTIAYKIDKLAS